MCWSTSRSRAVSWSSSGSTAGAGWSPPAKASSTKPASRGEKTASPLATRRTASAELGPGDRLGDVAARAGADDRDHVLGGVGDREREEALGRPLARDVADHLHAAAARHLDVEQHHVGLELDDAAHRVLDRGGVAEDLDEAVELRAHAGAEQLVVVDDDDGRRVAHVRAIRSSTSVPSPVVEWIAAVPPWRSMRPTIDSRTPRRSAGTAPGSKPGPRSRTNTSSSSSRTSANTDTAAPSPNFAALTIASRAAADDRLGVVVELRVADRHDVDRHAVRVLRLGGRQLERGLEGRALAERAAAVEPRAQLALLAAGERGDVARVVGLALHQRERLQDGVVQVRGELGALLRAHALGALVGEPAHEPDPERREDQRGRHQHHDHRQHHVAGGRQLVVEVEEQQRGADHQPDAQRRAPERAVARAPALDLGGLRRGLRRARRLAPDQRAARRRRARPATPARRRPTAPTRGTAAAPRTSASRSRSPRSTSRGCRARAGRARGSRPRPAAAPTPGRRRRARARPRRWRR
jgi:hypothetical protein